MSAYVRRGRRIADLIVDRGEYLVVELADRRRVRWAKNKPMHILEFGSLNPHNANFVRGGKIIETIIPRETKP